MNIHDSSFILKYDESATDSRKRERAQMLRLMEIYLRENGANGYKIKWSGWLETLKER